MNHRQHIWIPLASLVVVTTAQPYAHARETNTLTHTTFTAFDVETTGLMASKHYIIELGASQFRGEKLLSSRSWLVRPPIKIPASATRIHGITDKVLIDAPRFKAVYTEFLDYCSNTVLIAHNANFDVRFMEVERKRNGIPIQLPQTLDSLKLFRLWAPAQDSHKLTALAKEAGYAFPKAHRGDADAQMLAKLFILNQAKWSTGTLLELKEKTNVYPKPTASTQAENDTRPNSRKLE